MPAVPFPRASTPGQAQGEDQGRLINCFVEKNGDLFSWKRVPGLARFADYGLSPFRGMMATDVFVYVAAGNRILTIDRTGKVTLLAGDIPGTGPVQFARNNRFPSEIVFVTEYGAYVVDNLVVRVYPDGDLPYVGSVAFLDGFFLFTTDEGVIWASDLNTTEVNALSFANAEAKPDGLLRGVVAGGLYYACGQNSIEVWQNVGSAPFPLARASVIQTGLKARRAIAGFQDGWDLPFLFVAADNTVRQMNGYSPVRVSTPDVERSIAGSEPDDLEAMVYTFGGNTIWSLSGKDWTWEYNVSTQSWHERESAGLRRWRATESVKTFGGWIVADHLSNALLRLNQAYTMEVGEALTWGADSVPMKSFPTRSVISTVSLDFSLGRGELNGDMPVETDPKVMVSWSHDGAASWASPLERSLGQEGRYVGPIRINRLGMTTHHGFRLRWRVSDPVYTSFMGATVEGRDRRA